MVKTMKQRLRLNKNQYHILSDMCYQSKNVYNQALYLVRQHYFDHKEYLSYPKVYHLIKEQDLYRKLPTWCAQQSMKMVDKSFRSFFALLRLKNEGSYKEKVKIPHYKDKDEKFILIFPYKSNFAKIKNDKILLPITKEFKMLYNIKFLEIDFSYDMSEKRILEFRIIPKNKFFEIEIVYEDQKIKQKTKGENKLSIDLGLNNLLTCFDLNNKKSFIIDGKDIKSINRYFNKKISSLKSILKKVNDKNTSAQINKLWYRRENILKDKLHKISKYIVNYCIDNDINEIIIGNNKGWKQDINLGKKNNQNFVSIPYNQIINYLKYKGEEVNIKVNIIEESYTSKCSSLSNEKIEKKDQYNGKRIFRGLFKDSTINKTINADVNGAINIMRKSNPKLATIGTNGTMIVPVIIRQQNVNLLLKERKYRNVQLF
jgi:putative transposase